MSRRVWAAAGLLFVSLLPSAPRAAGVVGDPISGEEQRVSGHAARNGADQFSPDVSDSFIVWQDTRGTSVTDRGNAIWSKSLSTRGESPVTTLSTDRSPPRVSGRWVVWADRLPGSTNDDIFARKLPKGRVVRVTKHPATQLNPAIDGNTVVWEDKRNGDLDIFKRTLGGGKETPVVVASGDQTLPSISGDTVAWRDGRRGLTVADVYVRIGDGPETEVQRVTGAARSISSHQVAVSGDRLLWNEVDTTLCGSDCAPRILKTCVLPCATVHTLDALTPPSEQGSVLHDIDLSGTQATWAKTAQLPMDSEGHVFTADVASCDVPPCESPTQVDAAVAPQPVTPTSARVDGTRFAWSQQADGQDIFWRDFAAGIGPLRANSLSLGPFVGYTRPSADGDFVAYSNTGAVPGASETSVPGGIWATELEPRRHFVVAPLTTAFSAPAITGTRVAWSDSRKCQDASACDQPSMDVYERDPLDVGAEVQLSSPDFTAGSPDSDGSTTVWHCRSPTAADPPTRMCVHDGNSLQTIDLSPFLLDPSSVVGDRVRISAGVVGWYEFFEGGGPDARLHVLDTGTMSDQVVGQGVDVVGEFPDFDLSGSDIVWAGPDDPDRSKLWRNTVTGNAGTAVEFEVPVNRHVVNSVAVDGSRVVWIDCPSMLEEGCDVYTRDLGEFDSHLVSDGSRNGVLHPTVDDETDRVYWTYADQEDTQGLFMESLTGAPLPPGDTTAPSAPTNFTAGANTGTVGLSWVNPTDADFFRIRILRTGGKKPPKSLDDPKATVVHEGNGTSFTDTDVVTGVKYSYAIYAFDLSGNLSPLVTTSTG